MAKNLKTTKTTPKSKARGGRTHRSVGVSMDDQFFEMVSRRAAELKMNFSEYARRCIENDIRTGGAMTIKPWDATKQ
jgi:glycerol dehydrogenase-like iron-containing ADH family enzyme